MIANIHHIQELENELHLVQRAACIWFLRAVELLQQLRELEEAAAPFAGVAAVIDLPANMKPGDSESLAAHLPLGWPSVAQLRRLRDAVERRAS